MQELKAELNDARRHLDSVRKRKTEKLDKRSLLKSQVADLDKEIETLINEVLAVTRRIEDLKLLAERAEEKGLHAYKFTSDIWGYENGIGKAHTVHDSEFQAVDDEHAMKLAELEFNRYHWQEWKQDDKGWERHRSSSIFAYSWMRIERID